MATSLLLSLTLAAPVVSDGAAPAPLHPIAQRAQRVPGIWEGAALGTDGESYPFRLVLAQWDTRIWGMGEMTVNPGDPLTGIPAVRLAGTINGNVLVLGMSGALTNPCMVLTSTDAHVLTLAYDGAQTLSVVSVADNQPELGCGQVFQSFEVTRSDAVYEPITGGIVGTWEGLTVSPAGSFYAPFPAWPPRLTFTEVGGELLAAWEFNPGSTWGLLDIEWNPAGGVAQFGWPCLPTFRYEGVVDGNKLSGVFGYTSGGDADFLGVFCHTLQPEVVVPSPIAPCP